MLILRFIFILFTVSLAGKVLSQDQLTPIAVIPFEFENNRIRMDVDLDGHAIKMLLDSGASTSVLFASDQIKLDSHTVVGRSSVVFPALDETLDGTKLGQMNLTAGSLRVPLNKLVLLDNKTNLKERLLLRYDGIVGQELFSLFTIEVVPSQKQINVYPKGTDLSRFYRTKYPLYMQNGAPHIRFRSKMPWEQTPSKKEMLIDTGYPGAIVFWDSTHYRRAAKLTPEVHASNAAIVGRTSFRFGKLIFNHTPVYLGSYPPRQIGERDGLIGATILNNFRYAFDFAGKQMWMLSNTDDAGFRRTVDGTFYPPNNDAFVYSDFVDYISTGPTSVVRP